MEAVARISYLSVHFDTGPSSELPACKVRVVTRVNVVVWQRLVHVLVNVQSVEEDWCVLVGHEVIDETFLGD